MFIDECMEELEELNHTWLVHTLALIVGGNLWMHNTSHIHIHTLYIHMYIYIQ